MMNHSAGEPRAQVELQRQLCRLPAEHRERHVPLPSPFLNDGRESFQLSVRRYEVIQEARYKDSGVDLSTVLAAELPTRLPPELFIVWDNLPLETQSSYAETKRHLQTAFGQKDIIASFQAFPNARPRLPHEAMEVYAADVCRLVKEAFPEFEHKASEYMKMSRFIAGLDQELPSAGDLCQSWRQEGDCCDQALLQAQSVSLLRFDQSLQRRRPHTDMWRQRVAAPKLSVPGHVYVHIVTAPPTGSTRLP